MTAKQLRDAFRAQGLCFNCGKPAREGFRQCEHCAQQARDAQVRYGVRNRDRVFAHYGGKCACCGETTVEFLTTDHINNDGNKWRWEGRTPEQGRRGGGWNFYRWVIANNFPDDLQLLCYNCNFGKRRNDGVCPHKETI